MAGMAAGIDWASEAHEVCISREGEVVERFSAPHDERGIAGLAQRLTRAGIARVAIERPDGKSDRFDAYVLAELARTDAHRFQVLVPDGEETKALKALTRAREDLVGVRVELANQLRAQLEAFWPGALIFATLDSPISLAFRLQTTGG